MSTSDLFADLYFDLCTKTARLRDEKGALEVRLQQCEDQRKSLLFLVRSTARSLEENHFPQLADLLRSKLTTLEQDYAQPVKSHDHPASAVPGRPPHEERGGTVSEVAPELEGPEGLPVSDGTEVLPPGRYYAGEWDEVKS